MSYDIHLEQYFDFPPEHVWRALADSAALADWLMPNDFKPEVGHKFRFTAKPMPGWRGFVECEVLTCNPPHKLAFTWLGDDDWTQPTTVTFELKAEGSGTRLLFDHTGFVDPWGENASKMLSGGWPGLISKRLKTTLGV